MLGKQGLVICFFMLALVWALVLGCARGGAGPEPAGVQPEKPTAAAPAKPITPPASKRAAEPVDVATYVYKTADDCPIRADVYGGVSGDGPRKPVIFWIHGGALMVGSRLAPAKSPLRSRLLDAGFIIVSIDYRLAPETKVPQIIEDVQDGYRWVREKGPEMFGADPDRIGVVGGSAGGYLTLMTGFCVEPRPRALVSLFGYGDIAGKWLTDPSPMHVMRPPVPREKALSVIRKKPISMSGFRRLPFYVYCRQQGIWPNEVLGRDPGTDPAAFTPYCPLRNVTADYPPTLLIHGSRDLDVPHEQSVLMAKEFERVGVEHELMTLEGKGHGFVSREAWDKALAFFQQHVKEK